MTQLRLAAAQIVAGEKKLAEHAGITAELNQQLAAVVASELDARTQVEK